MTLSRASLAALESCHPDLQRVIVEAERDFPLTVLEGHRPRHRQRELWDDGKTHTLDSHHCESPSTAADVIPKPTDWSDLARFRALAAHIKATANRLGVRLRWGGDFRRFFDGPHYELLPPAEPAREKTT